MKAIIQDINELTDSREVLESKPHPFTTIFIYIVLAILLSAFIWSWFSEKEMVVKANGVVVPNKEIYKITNPVGNKIDTIQIKDGNKVKKGDVLYTIAHEELDLQKSTLDKTLKDTNTDIDNLNKLKKCVLDGKNYFNKEAENEKDYYSKYENYVLGNKDSKSQSHGIETQKKDLNEKISNLNLMIKSIDENKNYFSKESIYYSQYLKYKLDLKGYESKIDETQKIYDEMKKTPNSSKNQIDQALTSLNNVKDAKEQYKNQYVLSLKATIEESNSKTKEFDTNLNTLSESNDLNKQKNKSTFLVQIDSSLKTDKYKVDELTLKLKDIDMNIEKCKITSPSDGIVNKVMDIKKGDILQMGSTIANILPLNSKFKINLYIMNKDIANIKKNQKIKYHFQALPYKEYGYVNGKIQTISPDAKVDPKMGTSFYTAEAYVDNITLSSHKGEKAKIKSGMDCEAQIVTHREKMLYYLLEQLDLKD